MIGSPFTANRPEDTMAKRTTTPEVPASPPVTFGPNHPLILAMVAEAV